MMNMKKIVSICVSEPARKNNHKFRVSVTRDGSHGTYYANTLSDLPASVQACMKESDLFYGSVIKPNK